MKIKHLLLPLIVFSTPLAYPGITTSTATLFDIGFKKLNFAPIEKTEVIQAEIIHRKNFKVTQKSTYLVSGNSMTNCNIVYGSLMGEETHYIKALGRVFAFEKGNVGNPKIQDYEHPEISIITFPIRENGNEEPYEIEFHFTNKTFVEANTLISNSSLVKRSLALDPTTTQYTMPQTSFLLIEDDVIKVPVLTQ